MVHIDSHDYAIINKEDIIDYRNLFNEELYNNLPNDYEYLKASYRCKSIQLSPNTTYTVSQRAGVTSSIILLLHNKEQVNDTGYFDCRKVSDVKTYTTDDSGKLYIGITENVTQADFDARLLACKIQIELGSTQSEYVPFEWKKGKNLLARPFYGKDGVSGESVERDGVTYTVSEDGRIKGIGTTERGTNYFFENNKTLMPGTYTLSYTGKLLGLNLLVYDYQNNLVLASLAAGTETVKQTTFTISAQTNVRVYFNIGSASQEVDIDLYPMLEEGATASPYEPYNQKALIKSLSADFPLQQDLHGYDHPWGPGMGKNLIKVDESHMSGHAAAGTYYTTFCVNNNNINEFHLKAYRSYVLSALVECNISPSFCISIGAGNGGYDKDIIYTPYQDPGLRKFEVCFIPFDTHLSAGDILAIRVPNTGGHPQAYDYKIHWIQIEEDAGSGDPTPYEEMSNVCPITTYSGLDFDVVKTKYKNLLGGLELGNAIVNAVNNTQYSNFYSDYNGKYVTIRAGSPTNNKVFSNRIIFKANTRYTIILKLTRNTTGATLNSNIIVRYTDSTTSTIYFREMYENKIVYMAFATINGKTVESIATAFGGGTTKIYYDECGIFEGVLTVKDYEPYAPSIYKHYSDIFSTPIAKGSFEHVSGKLTGLYKKVVFDGSENWTIQPGSNAAMLSNALPGIKANATPISNYLRYTTSSTDSRKLGYFTFSGTRITLGNKRWIGTYISYNFWANAAAVKAYLAANPLEIAYELETPISETITTDFIQLYDGKNVLSSDRDLKVTFFDGTEMMGKKFTILLISRYSTMPVHVETDSRFGPNLILPRTKPTHTRDNGWELMFLSKDTELPPGCVCEFDTIGGVIEVPVENSKCELPDSILEDLQANGVTGHVCAIGLNAKYVILDFNLEVVNRFWPYNV